MTSFQFDSRQYWLGPLSAPYGMLDPGGLSRVDPGQAAFLLGWALRGEVDTIRLRSLLHASCHPIPSWSDHEVRTEALRLVADGSWTLWRRDGPAMVGAAGGGGGAAAASSSSAAASPASSASSSPPRAQARPPAAPVSSAPAEPEWTAAVRQDAYAATLEQAARAGTPFCEICA